MLSIQAPFPPVSSASPPCCSNILCYPCRVKYPARDQGLGYSRASIVFGFKLQRPWLMALSVSHKTHPDSSDIASIDRRSTAIRESNEFWALWIADILEPICYQYSWKLYWLGIFPSIMWSFKVCKGYDICYGCEKMIKFNCVPKHLCTLTRPGRAYMNPMLDTSSVGYPWQDHCLIETSMKRIVCLQWCNREIDRASVTTIILFP